MDEPSHTVIKTLSLNRAMSKSIPRRRHQQGVVLLFMALLVLVTVSAVLINTLGDTNKLVDVSRNQQQSLNDAREALLGYAIAYPERNTAVAEAIPGYLPCPDRDGDGLSDDAQCGDAEDSAIGFLPWQTLGLVPPDANECLLYAVSGGFKSPNSSATPGLLNSDLDGLFQIEDERSAPKGGTIDRDRAIAVVFLPGEPLSASSYTQLRSSTSTRTHCGAMTQSDAINLPQSYLDRLGDVNNANGTRIGAASGAPGGQAIPTEYASVFVTGPESENDSGVQFNDKAIWIGSSEYQRVRERMNKWVLSKVQSCVAAYGDIHIVGGTKRYPWPSALNTSAIPDYSEDANQRFGRIPLSFILTTNQWENEPGVSPAIRCFSWPWWVNWREQVFIAVADAHTDIPIGPTVDTQLDGASTEFVVLLANRRLATQQRTAYSDSGQIDNYLELDNIPGSNEGFMPPGNEKFISGTLLGTFNDLACSQSACSF